jgi:hypothetical protein
VAVNCRVAPTLIDELTGAMLMETSAGCTLNVVAPKIVPRVAWIVEVPELPPVASPWLLTVATVVLDEFHIMPVVRVFVLPSLYVPVATSCFVPPVMTVGFTGVTLMDTSARGVTVSIVEPEMLPDAARMVTVP